VPYSNDSQALIGLIAADLANALIATDFDGTLSPIVEDPALAVPCDGAIAVLRELSAHCGELAVVSGRPVSYLSRFVPAEVTVVGLYGLESLKDGQTQVHSNAGIWRETMDDVATAARLRGPKGMVVECKGLSITLHYRGHPELEKAVEAYSEIAAHSGGLRRRAARMSFELHPPIDEDKGTVIRRLAADQSGPVVYIGDDIGDLPAFEALDELAAAGRPVARVCVSSSEVTAQLVERADLVLNGPGAVVEFMKRLIEAAQGQ